LNIYVTAAQFVKWMLASTCRNHHSCYLYTYMMNARVLQNRCDGDCRLDPSKLRTPCNGACLPVPTVRCWNCLQYWSK